MGSEGRNRTADREGHGRNVWPDAASPAPGAALTSVASLLAEAAERLAASGVEQPGREARLLLAHALGFDLEGLLRLPRNGLVASAPFRALVARRTEGRVPLDFILGRRGFWTLDLEVSPATLIPRADSETLVEHALALCVPRAATATILDLGTGSGALLLACLTEFACAFGVGVDRIEAAAELARRNARRAGLADRAAFVCGNWAAPLGRGRFDLVLCNPPYVETAALSGLMPEVRDHEPPSALDGGADGLDAYRAVLAWLPETLAPGGLAIFEAGEGQADAIERLSVGAGLVPAGRRRDLPGIERAVALRHAQS